GARRLRVALDQVAEERPGVAAEADVDERQCELEHRLWYLGRPPVVVEDLLEFGDRVGVLILLDEGHPDGQVGLRRARVLRKALDEHPVEPPAFVTLPARQALPGLLPELLLVVRQ